MKNAPAMARWTKGTEDLKGITQPWKLDTFYGPRFPILNMEEPLKAIANESQGRKYSFEHETWNWVF